VRANPSMPGSCTLSLMYNAVPETPIVSIGMVNWVAASFIRAADWRSACCPCLPPRSSGAAATATAAGPSSNFASRILEGLVAWRGSVEPRIGVGCDDGRKGLLDWLHLVGRASSSTK
jgi:hypothetical protein